MQDGESNKISVPKLYYYDPRKLNVILTQIRCTASFLNHDLHKVHILSAENSNRVKRNEEKVCVCVCVCLNAGWCLVSTLND
jgi:hypothetical protein